MLFLQALDEAQTATCSLTSLLKEQRLPETMLRRFLSLARTFSSVRVVWVVKSWAAVSVNDIMAKVLKADVVCWATPIYYYEMSGQMKTLIDRMNAMYEQDYAFRDVYLLTTAAEDENNTPKRAETGLTGWIDCYPKSRLAGTLFCGGVNDPREIEGNPKLQEAYELGFNGTR